ncbi:MAG TPA: chromate resistance protein ChrB domain-containing protein [Candidatus Micrarchaeaceae archaeon]|nr:chromate resistance protein ChrB domain-containing protein [Candidatus Micrarchaeaceae archaeon]
MKRVTRKNASVDRIACPWLIKRFIDPDAEFLYAPAADVSAVAEREDAIPYDVGGVELGHVDGRCSFESIILKYGLNDAALDHLAAIVHGADVSADIAVTPEAAGLKAIAHGFAMVHGEDDHRKIALETPLYDALYAWCQHQAGRLTAAAE